MRSLHPTPLAVVLALAATLAGGAAQAAQPAKPEPAAKSQPPPGLQPVPEPPEVPGRVQSGSPMEPDVRIIRGEHKVVTEYLVNGRLRAIKVERDGFPPYYLVDTTGDGRLDHRVNDLDSSGLRVPMWVILSW